MVDSCLLLLFSSFSSLDTFVECYRVDLISSCLNAAQKKIFESIVPVRRATVQFLIHSVFPIKLTESAFESISGCESMSSPKDRLDESLMYVRPMRSYW